MPTYHCTFRGLTQIIACLDLETDEALRWYEANMPANVAAVYSDPPWNPGNATYWRTFAHLDPCLSYERFVESFVGIVGLAVRYGARQVLVEQSINPDHYGYFIRAMEKELPGWGRPAIYEVVYSKRPNALIHYGLNPLTTSPEGMSSDSMTLRAMFGAGIRPGEWVVEPCVGLGMTSRACHSLGYNMIGSELNPARLAKTLGWLERQGYTIEERP